MRRQIKKLELVFFNEDGFTCAAVVGLDKDAMGVMKAPSAMLGTQTLINVFRKCAADMLEAVLKELEPEAEVETVFKKEKHRGEEETFSRN